MAKKKLVVFDIDGCIFDCGHRIDQFGRANNKPEAVARDTPIQVGITLVRAFLNAKKSYVVLFITSRSEKLREVTLAKLHEHVHDGIESEQVLMRTPGIRDDFQVRPENMLKVRMLKDAGYEPEDVFFAYEDRNHMVRAWRALGVTCLQPKESDF